MSTTSERLELEAVLQVPPDRLLAYWTDEAREGWACFTGRLLELLESA